MAKISDEILEIFANCLSAVETGGQIYGKGDWDNITLQYTNSDTEHAITIGAYARMGVEAQALLKRIRTDYPDKFYSLDKAGISGDLDCANWGKYQLPATNCDKAASIAAIIGCPEGIHAQKVMMGEDAQRYANQIEAKYGVKRIDALLHLVNVRHLGGTKPLERIIGRIASKVTLEAVRDSLLQDTIRNQVGAEPYRKRQALMYQWLHEKVTPLLDADGLVKGEECMSKIENAVSRAEAIARDDSHGYDQVDRWGNPNYDCSGLVIDCLEKAGIPAKSNGATYTGNMKRVLRSIGFAEVINQVNLSNGSGMKRGDVLLNEGSHTAFYCGNGQLVHASINEKGGITGGQSGDQTGREICIRSYYNKPWNSVLRYTGEASGSGTATVKGYLSKGDTGDAVKEMQKMLVYIGFSCGSSGIDGSFGNDTDNAVMAFQRFYGLEVDGKYGPASKAKLISAYSTKASASTPSTSEGQPTYSVGKDYTLQVELRVRTGAGTNMPAKSHGQLTADGQKHDKDRDGCLDTGTVVTCQAVQKIGNDVWIKAPSGWMAAYYQGKVYIK